LFNYHQPFLIILSKIIFNTKRASLWDWKSFPLAKESNQEKKGDSDVSDQEKINSHSNDFDK